MKNNHRWCNKRVVLSIFFQICTKKRSTEGKESDGTALFLLHPLSDYSTSPPKKYYNKFTLFIREYDRKVGIKLVNSWRSLCKGIFWNNTKFYKNKGENQFMRKDLWKRTAATILAASILATSGISVGAAAPPDGYTDASTTVEAYGNGYKNWLKLWNGTE